MASTEESGDFESKSRSYSRPSSVASSSSSSSSDHSRRSSDSQSRQALTAAAPDYTPQPEGYEGYRDATQQRYSGHSYAADTKPTSAVHQDEARTIHPFDEEPENPKADDDSDEAPWTDSPEHPLLSKLALPIALLVGAGLAGGTTYAVIARVQHLLATAAVDGDLEHWKRKAHYDVYDACYNGCTSCDDPNFAFNACKTTAQAIVKGVNCDGNLMWNWRVEHRYPDACLSAVAVILMGEALERLKQSYRRQYGLIALTVVAGLVAGLLVYKLVRYATMTPSQRRAKHSDLGQSAKKFGKSAAKAAAKGAARSRRSGGGGGGSSKKIFGALLGLLAAPRGAKAVTLYPCTGLDPAWYQFFASPDGAIAGVVHGWFSECRDRRDCHKTCKNVCTTNSSGTRTCKDKCTDSCKTVVVTERPPKVFVERMMPKVRACGFQMRDAPDGKQLATRIGNAGIEKNYWVRISVNGLNVTKADQTDKMVMCLHGIGDISP
ncbi:hypothetical protein B0T14DRAFT_271018 [Immersiella caudata]|uniref:Uncharacterized protein n=1 Tax=Immersiella caudata TaxID=314043 RepID=A0AA39WLA4_9PEZI|nr:hypothetical protein B0T14DRAFT_271018 [Immersiella caudata]